MKNNQWTEEIELLKSIIQKTDMEETVKWGIPVFTYDGKNVVGIAGFKSYFGLWFYNGVFLKDDKNLLINAQKGTTKAQRQMRFQSKDEVDEKIIINYLKEAIEVEKKGLKIKPEKKTTEIPEILQNALDNNTQLKAQFNTLTPFKQREYCEHIASAKQEKTKINRLEKVKPMILEGKGLNDRYR